MKIVLITPTPPDISAFGVRTISSFLREKGFETVLVFLPGSIGLSTEDGAFVYSYPPEILKQVTDLCQGASLVGVSFMTNYFDRAVCITEAVKKETDIPVIWGGIHPSTKPEEALEHADMVCIGEGEFPLLDLLSKMQDSTSYYDVKGIWFNKDGEVIKNAINTLVEDLDSLPFYDYSNENHFIFDREHDKIVPLTNELLENIQPLLPYRNNSFIKAYRTMSTRGCPHRCSYCNVPQLMEVYGGGETKYFRFRSIENLIKELEEVTARFPFIEAIQFFDDTFFARSMKDVETFSVLYKEKIGLPFYCQASPTTLTRKKLELFIDAGLVYVEMGIQAGSAKIKEMYKRKESNDKIVEATRLLSEYKYHLLQPDYHVIIDNPWEDEEDVMETVRLLYQISKPFGLCISSLIFFPHTELYFRAKEEHLIKDEVKEIYRRPFYVPPQSNYPNFLIYLLSFQHFPRKVLGSMMGEKWVKFFSGKDVSFLFTIAYGIGESIRMVAKGITAVRHGNWDRILNYFRRLIIGDPVVAGRKH